MPRRVILGAAPVADPQPVCRFWKLPLELRFAIYDHSYSRNKTITPRASGTLVQLGRGRVQEQQSDENNRRKRKTVIGKRLVSKQFLVETLQHLAEANTFSVKWTYGGFAFISNDFARHIRSLKLCWNVHAYDGKMDLNQLCPRLRTLQLVINTGSLFHDDLTPAIVKDGLANTSIVRVFSSVRGITRFSVVWDEYHTARPAYPWPSRRRVIDVRAKAEKFRRRLERMLVRMVTKDNDIGADESVKANGNGSNSRSGFRERPRKA